MVLSRLVAGFVIIVSGITAVAKDPEVLAAVTSVIWRLEDLVALPSWVEWVVLLGLVVSAVAAIDNRLQEVDET
jgi:hypothetical protein